MHMLESCGSHVVDVLERLRQDETVESCRWNTVGRGEISDDRGRSSSRRERSRGHLISRRPQTEPPGVVSIPVPPEHDRGWSDRSRSRKRSM